MPQRSTHSTSTTRSGTPRRAGTPRSHASDAPAATSAPSSMSPLIPAAGSIIAKRSSDMTPKYIPFQSPAGPAPRLHIERDDRPAPADDPTSARLPDCCAAAPPSGQKSMPSSRFAFTASSRGSASATATDPPRPVRECPGRSGPPSCSAGDGYLRGASRATVRRTRPRPSAGRQGGRGASGTHRSSRSNALMTREREFVHLHKMMPAASCTRALRSFRDRFSCGGGSHGERRPSCRQPTAGSAS